MATQRPYTKVLLVTANVGSIFEDPEKMLKMWLAEFLATVKRLEPDFLAVHCQEVGGKNYEESMQHVNQFIKTLLASDGMQSFDKARIFLDEDFTAVDKFTALGNLYFIRDTVTNIHIWDYEGLEFVPVVGKEVLSGNIEGVTIKEKAKFPQEFFPDFKWSRKGFIRTRWNICNTIFDLINIHLFHDASNIIAMETSPSVYSENRRRTLIHTLKRFETDDYTKHPFFLFGDFNFRLDTHDLIKKLTDKAIAQQTLGKKNEVSKIMYTANDNGKVVLTIGKKDFDHMNHNNVFSNNNGQWLLKYDREPSAYKDCLSEHEIMFPPSYPFSEDVSEGASYMKTRCPAYCDRIMFTDSTKDLLYDDGQTPEYNMIGSNVCMGDHKVHVNLMCLC
ncbi:hypothetical protein CAPTEDRAFT_131585 [Capitella teleta]|uniref:inositol-polyphosphate 5-phosphatase n=1 Tax=Capitella teleta TaxID=283909 RepID=R7UCL8_CAPTE|nr:hypothetical protein CAPTEDRAFT_131585 [Capitella teleta]|eukprot:ELU03856.1 hypothetical protein CAPTEDRAFT_131585 [Capitella teleta]